MSIFEDSMEALEALTPLAVNALKEVLEDVNAPADAKVKAAKVVLHYISNNPIQNEDSETDTDDSEKIVITFGDPQHDEWAK